MVCGRILAGLFLSKIGHSVERSKPVQQRTRRARLSPARLERVRHAQLTEHQVDSADTLGELEDRFRDVLGISGYWIWALKVENVIQIHAKLVSHKVLTPRYSFAAFSSWSMKIANALPEHGLIASWSAENAATFWDGCQHKGPYSDHEPIVPRSWSACTFHSGCAIRLGLISLATAPLEVRGPMISGGDRLASKSVSFEDPCARSLMHLVLPATPAAVRIVTTNYSKSVMLVLLLSTKSD